MDGYLRLQEALVSNRLDDFIAQAEAEGIEGEDHAEFAVLVEFRCQFMNYA
jgi:hypothetical protein